MRIVKPTEKLRRKMLAMYEMLRRNPPPPEPCRRPWPCSFARDKMAQEINPGLHVAGIDVGWVDEGIHEGYNVTGGYDSGSRGIPAHSTEDT